MVFTDQEKIFFHTKELMSIQKIFLQFYRLTILIKSKHIHIFVIYHCQLIKIFSLYIAPAKEWTMSCYLSTLPVNVRGMSRIFTFEFIMKVVSSRDRGT